MQKLFEKLIFFSGFQNLMKSRRNLHENFMKKCRQLIFFLLFWNLQPNFVTGNKKKRERAKNEKTINGNRLMVLVLVVILVSIKEFKQC